MATLHTTIRVTSEVFQKRNAQQFQRSQMPQVLWREALVEPVLVRHKRKCQSVMMCMRDWKGYTVLHTVHCIEYSAVNSQGNRADQGGGTWWEIRTV